MEQSERNESGHTNRRLTLLCALVPSVPEIRALLAQLLLRPLLNTAFVMAWSLFRRQHQAQAALAHYKKRKNPQL
jgi:hypothetical protein